MPVPTAVAPASHDNADSVKSQLLRAWTYEDLVAPLLGATRRRLWGGWPLLPPPPCEHALRSFERLRRVSADVALILRPLVSHFYIALGHPALVPFFQSQFRCFRPLAWRAPPLYIPYIAFGHPALVPLISFSPAVFVVPDIYMNSPLRISRKVHLNFC